jgi:hypothetical protein
VRVGQSQVPQLALAGGQAAANLAQGLCLSQMTEQHGYELAPTTEPTGVALGPEWYRLKHHCLFLRI